ncbi:hypothetical protein [Zobellia sp. B3R18]|uniref:hypothetical protein n=1 Tax=Zobellia sp. B3R18 TaxID=2841568 RepID=UPI001C074A18|nr:hypothetical protein [Zobellia sp. B3R18]MBU2974937.1 hypothetical protein [Zobellia sp. B3R18]
MENILIKNTSFSEYEARIKLLVLSFSVQFENFASKSLVLILNLDEQAISLGNNSQALSMNQKIQLMLDSKFFSKKDKQSIITFMSIRNQFMHNSNAKSLESCLSFLTGKDKFIENAYLKKKEENEKAGGERAANVKKDEEINEKELRSYDISEKEKLLFKSWVSLASDVADSFEKVFIKISEERKF